MKKFLHKIFEIRQDELTKVSFSFAYIFLIIASLLIVKPVRNSLFLTRYGIHMLPYAFLLVAVFASVIIEFYSKLSKRIRFNRLVQFTLIISMVSLLIFWALLQLDYQAGWFFFVIYIWVALFGAITTSQFWLLANYVFNARQAKRLFGLIGAGAISGGITGGYLTRFLAPLIGTANMMLICLLFLTICIFLLSKIWSQDTQNSYTEQLLKEEKHRSVIKSDNPVKIIFKSRHLTYISIIVGIGVIVANLVDYQYNAIASDIIHDKDELTAFFGFWLSNLSIASLLVQMLLTGRLLKRFGVITSLYLLPFGIILGAVSILFFPALWSAIIIKVSDGGFKQSINKAGLELLIIPVPWQMKNQAKSFIDVFIDSFATGLGGLLLILVTSRLGFSVSEISIVTILLIFVWIIMIRKVKWEYLNSFRQAIEKRTLDMEQVTTQFDDTLMVSYLTQTLENANSKQLIYMLELLENADVPQLEPHLHNLLEHNSWEVRLKALAIIENYDSAPFMAKITEMVNDKHFEIKIAAITFLIKHHTEDTTFLHALLANNDYKICSAAILAASNAVQNSTLLDDQIKITELFDNFINQTCINDLKPKQINFVQIALIRFIGNARQESLYPFLLNYFYQDSTRVVRAAIDNAGATRHPMFIPELINCLKNNTLKSNARNALTNYGNAILPYISEILSKQETNTQFKIVLSKVLSRINTQETIKLLIDYIENSDLLFRYFIIKALNSLRTQNPLLKLNTDLIEKIIFNESENYYKHLAELNILECIDVTSMNDGSLNALNLLRRALSERIDNTLEKIFRLMGLIYPPGDIYNAFLAITSRKIDSNANAVEFLDNLLHNKLKRHILPIVEYANEENKQGMPFIDMNIQIESESQVYNNILYGDDPWLKSCLLYYLTTQGIKLESEHLNELQDHQDTVLSETAQLYYREIYKIRN